MGPFGPNEAGHRDRGREALTRSAQKRFLIIPNDAGCYLTVTRNRDSRETT
jgi:hypothetical protein